VSGAQTDQPVVLVVDDSRAKAAKLKADLEAGGHKVATADGGNAGWELLLELKGSISAILLDRVMTDLNGIAFMNKLKSHPDLTNIPVIMVTAANSHAEVSEGIEAGVYYYMTYPYNTELMQSLVRSASADYLTIAGMLRSIRQISEVVDLMRECNFEIRTLDDVKRLSPTLSVFFTDPERVILGISEILTNAVEHGNLGITYDEKSELVTNNTMHAEIERRLQHPEYRDRRVNISLIASHYDITLWIRDQGKGFEWKNYLTISPERATDNHGRGIAMSCLLSFDSVQYLGKGNEVIFKVNR
jgi:CheY-like chemotaxis protein/anti-sigma regulatory factor (Ser/Thr protein kinase)